MYAPIHGDQRRLISTALHSTKRINVNEPATNEYSSSADPVSVTLIDDFDSTHSVTIT